MALCGARGGDLRSATFPRRAPPGSQVPEVRLGPIFERFLETKVSIRLEFFLDNILVSKCTLVLRSSNLFLWLVRSTPPQTACTLHP